MKQYYVYIVKCKDKSYYTGVTNSLERRIQEHNSGKSSTAYTYNKRPVELVWYEEFSNIDEAISIEKQIKGWSRRKKEAIINDNWEKLVEYSKNYTQYGKSSTDTDRSSTGSD
ncbi:GIY-YIG nuclease family protein [Lutibacter sp. HS1-25]|uniref:GIY-YIG nuclease family protein n=1 Tax=Lutibacter sp. HS1-25 TaxID=2485000 RepID=UPI001013B292|nr:GIY-YIG nuclease family protein [Lutibacter sp. HS1-25]RXP52734.1 GIY-YIG nuclease family protein [Lutibacter sp. HS1-25]